MRERLMVLLLLLCTAAGYTQKNYTGFVDPFIGTGGHGHTYPGAVLPHGMVQLSPDTRLEGWDGCSGYHYSDSFIYGFTHTHLSGTGCSDYGDILLMPMSGKPSPDNKVYGSAFSHSTEKAAPGYYQVRLADDDITVQLTATERVGLHHYRFSKTGPASIILDLKHRDEVLESSLQLADNKTITGMRRSKAWASDQYVYFAIEFSIPFTQAGIWTNDELLPAGVRKAENAKNIKAYVQFAEMNKPVVMAKVAISGVSVEGALKNLRTEMPGWDFAAVQNMATQKWNRELGRIAVQGGTTSQLRTFYTALYHTMVVPNINMDVDGRYRGRDNQVHKAVGFTNYSVFSLWDTYRGAHPLYTIIDQARTRDYIRSFLVQYQQGGRLPVWELSGCETDCMIGYHSVPVIVDAYMKGIRDFDQRLALEAMLKSANWNHLGLPALADHGVLEKDDEHESVSKTLEYAYDDWCIGIYAKALGNTAVYKQFMRRAQSWKNLFDPQTFFMRPRKNGDWLKPFDPYEVNNNFTEGNSWQYAFYVPQDMEQYIGMLGGKRMLETRLDSIFGTTSTMTGLELPDITGLIGQYAHGNEPSHHIAYLYNFAGKPWKGQQKIRYILDHLYADQPDGLTGNEDCGQMSAWYVLSAMGFYPVTPGTQDYMLGTPLFPGVTLHLENGKSFTIRANEPGEQNFYVQDALLNGRPHNQSWFTHTAILRGGNLSLRLGEKPSAFGTTTAPVTSITDELIVPNPVIDGGGMGFKGKTTVSIQVNQPGAAIFYTTDGADPGGPFAQAYTMPLDINASTVVKAIAYQPGGRHSFVTTARFIKALHNWNVTLHTPCEKQYTGGGNDALIDGIRGDLSWRKGNWQGWQKADMDITIDLQQVMPVHTITTGFIQDTRAWIVLPKMVIAEWSADGKQFTALPPWQSSLPVDDLTVQLKKAAINAGGVQARYIRIRALQYGQMPAWHEGAGGDTHIFCDEVEVE